MLQHVPGYIGRPRSDGSTVHFVGSNLASSSKLLGRKERDYVMFRDLRGPFMMA
jgi:hypothetical protein